MMTFNPRCTVDRTESFPARLHLHTTSFRSKLRNKSLMGKTGNGPVRPGKARINNTKGREEGPPGLLLPAEISRFGLSKEFQPQKEVQISFAMGLSEFPHQIEFQVEINISKRTRTVRGT